MKKPDQAERRRVSLDGVADDMFVKRFPKILEYLITDVWDDGTAREPSALAITVKDGNIQVALNDKALKQSLYTSAPTLQDGLKLMEKAIADGVGSWRSWKAGKAR